MKPSRSKGLADLIIFGLNVDLASPSFGLYIDLASTPLKLGLVAWLVLILDLS